VRAIDEATPARFNADRARLFEASGSAGKIGVFAVRLDTFERERDTITFYVGTNDPRAFTLLRRTLLAGNGALPISAEYLHRDAFDLAARYGKDIFLAISLLGTERLPGLNRWKDRVDRLVSFLPGHFGAISDRLLHAASRLIPDHLPARLREMRNRCEHHLLLKVSAADADATRRLVSRTIEGEGDWFECSPQEAAKAFLHRFVIAGAAVRFALLHPNVAEDVLALDIALPRNGRDWFERLPPALAASTIHEIYYGHFLCQVFHQDYVIRKGCDVAALKQAILTGLEQRGAECPAEHNVGRHYPAKPALKEHYRELDPSNLFNPGIGMLSKVRDWQ
jgi:D-lactate dehydrogenase